MKRNQRLRHDIAAATRRNPAGGARNTELALVEGKYHRSTLGIGGLRAMGMFYSGGDYWN